MKKLVTENHVKDLVLDWYKAHNAYNFAVVQNGMGVHGILDRNGCLPLTVTPAMVGKVVGLYIGVESKRPGRRGEKNRGMSPHQFDHMTAINAAGGLAICCDGYEDLAELDRELLKLITV